MSEHLERTSGGGLAPRSPVSQCSTGPTVDILMDGWGTIRAKGTVTRRFRKWYLGHHVSPFCKSATVPTRRRTLRDVFLGSMILLASAIVMDMILVRSVLGGSCRSVRGRCVRREEDRASPPNLNSVDGGECDDRR